MKTRFVVDPNFSFVLPVCCPKWKRWLILKLLGWRTEDYAQ